MKKVLLFSQLLVAALVSSYALAKSQNGASSSTKSYYYYDAEDSYPEDSDKDEDFDLFDAENDSDDLDL